MYQDFFNLRESPFNLTPDPRFFFSNGSVQEAFATLCQGVERRKGIIVISGAAGTGKTTLLKRFIQSAASRVCTLGILDPHLTFAELLQCAFGTFGLPPCAIDDVTMTEQLERYLVEQFKRDRVVTLLIDEAQELDDVLLERLGMLANLQHDGAPLLQIVLLGQPTINERLAMPLFARLHECVGLRSQLRPLTHGEIQGYVDYRLSAAGYYGEPIFTAPAIERIAAFSAGIPRVINVICDNALLTASAIAQPRVGTAIIDDVADELQLGAPPTYVAHGTSPAQQIPEAWVADKPVDDYGMEEIDALPGNRAKKYLSDDSAGMAPTSVRSPRIEESPSSAIHSLGLALGVATLILVVAAFVTVPPSSNSFESVQANLTRIQQAITPLSGQFYRVVTTHGENPEANVARYTDQELTEIRPAWRAPVQAQGAVSDDPSKGLNSASNRGGKSLSQPQPAPVQTSVPQATGERSKKRNVLRARPVEFVVVDNSFVRTEPSSEAEIVMALRPGTHIQLVNRRGDYLLVRAPESGLNQGFVHKEDAFFEPLN